MPLPKPCERCGFRMIKRGRKQNLCRKCSKEARQEGQKKMVLQLMFRIQKNG